MSHSFYGQPTRFPRFGILVVATIEQFCLCAGKLGSVLASPPTGTLVIRQEGGFSGRR